MKLSERMKHLLTSAAQELDDGGDPFESGWLQREKVTLDECITVSGIMAFAMRWYARIPDNARSLAHLREAMDQ